jgi:hypothetical protein
VKLSLANNSWLRYGILLFGIGAMFMIGQATAEKAIGPLQVHPTNPRYFTDGSSKAVYLTGSHTWGNLCDYPPSQWPPFDYQKYLDFLGRYNHNFIRLWAGHSLGPSPCPYERTGPGTATDGGPKVDLNRVNQSYFDRLRARVRSAGDRGIYVGIMLFEPDAAKKEDREGSLFNPPNNIQGLNGDTNVDGSSAETYDLSVPQITTVQEAYVRKVIDTVNDLDNVLYEIGNEGDLSSVEWQYYFINLIKEYQAEKPQQHPVGMTAVFDIVGGTWTTRNEALFDSPADWISPGLDPYEDDPPASNGRKVIIADVDHIWPRAPRRRWVWKCFLRGIQPILMDWYTYGKPTWASNDEQEAMRRAMGHTRAYAGRIPLAEMAPHTGLSSTGYCLANPGVAYLVYLPDGGGVTVDLSLAKETFEVEWFRPVEGTVEQAAPVQGGATRRLTAPFEGDAVLYLWRR